MAGRGKPKGLPKSGGKVKGSKNKVNTEFKETIIAMMPDYHPVVAMAVMANDKLIDPTLRLQAHKEVAKYFEPQLKSIEISNPDGTLQPTLHIIRETIGKPPTKD
jgi:hypothetical protein